MKTILVPVDFSAATTQVCDAAFELARLINARLVLLHAVEPPPIVMGDYYAFDSGLMADAVQSGRKFAMRELLKLGARYQKRRATVRTVAETGSPVAVVREKADELKADYIVMGSHGHGAVYDLIAGSTTHGVLRKAPCPVLVVPMFERRTGRKRR